MAQSILQDLEKRNKEVEVRLFFEQVFHDAVELAKKNNDTLITTSQARNLHKLVVEDLNPPDGRTFTKVGQNNLLQSINNVFESKGYGKIFNHDTKLSDSNEYMKILNDFKMFSSKKSTSMETLCLPLSPYDPDFQNRSLFRENGSSMLYLTNKTVLNITDLNDLFHKKSGEKIKAMKLSQENGDVSVKPVGSITSKDDYSGMSILSNYMSAKEYNEVKDWISNIDPNEYMDDQMLGISADILTYLKSNGIEYSIKCDRNEGQLKASIVGTGISIRVADTRSNKHFIGRVMDSDRELHYSTDRRVMENGSYKTMEYSNLTSEDCINMIKFAMGDYIYTGMTDENGKNVPSGLVGTYEGVKGTKYGAIPAYKHKAYYSSGDQFSMVVKQMRDKNGNPYNVLLRSKPLKGIQNDLIFKEKEDAETYLKEAISSAKDNLRNIINIDGVIQEFEFMKNNDGYEPVFDGSDNIVKLKYDYLSFLKNGSPLYKPCKELEELLALDEHELDKERLSSLEYSGTLREQLDSHMNDFIDYYVGQYEMDDAGERFSPISVAKYMSHSRGESDNVKDIESSIKKLDINHNELKGDDFYTNYFKDKLLKFNPDNAQKLKDLAKDSPFLDNIYRNIVRTVRTSGCLISVNDVLMDDMGVIQYKAKKINKEIEASGSASLNINNVQNYDEIVGEIGQIFIPEKDGYVKSKFLASNNYIFVPGYTASVVAQQEGENKSVEERTKLMGYEQILNNEIKYKIRRDIANKATEIGSSTSVNNVYRRLYDTRHPLDYFDKSREEGMSDELRTAILKTESARIKYNDDIKKNATINTDFRAKSGLMNIDVDNDNFHDAYSLVDKRNMSVLTTESNGYFDPIATGNSTNQGITRFLVDSAKVRADGFIEKGDENDRVALFKLDEMKYSEFNPFDRQQMVFTVLMAASSVTDKANVCNMTFGGWTQDDAIVVSQEFANKYQIRGSDGNMRELVVGDKISDLHGNKGVISLIVDRNMSDEDMYEQNLDEAVSWFRANPDMEVVMAPFPAVSRFNGGSTRELMQDTKDVVNPHTGEVY